MIGPCDEGGATGRCQRVKPTFDPLEPTLDIALKNFGGVRSKGPKVPRTTRRAGQARWPRRALVDDRRSFVASESTHPRWDPPCGDDAPRRCANAICRRASASVALARHHVDPAVGGDGFGQVHEPRADSGCSRLWQQEIGTFTHFRERCESLQTKALAEIVISSTPMNVDGAAQLTAASCEDNDRGAM
jgi:hypothetical protein